LTQLPLIGSQPSDLQFFQEKHQATW